jgi:GntR family transcriptional regulator
MTMLIQIAPHNGVPVYRQILDQVRFQITAGVLQPGDPLDSVRTLAAALGVNSMTVSKAYSLLEKEHLVERRRGQQLVVAAAEYTRQETSRETHVRDALAPAVTIIRQLNVSPEQALEIFREMLRDGIEETNTHELYR